MGDAVRMNEGVVHEMEERLTSKQLLPVGIDYGRRCKVVPGREAAST